MVNYTKPETKKECVIKKLSTPSTKENGSIVIRKTINMCLCWIFLSMVTEWAECYCGTVTVFFLQKTSAASPEYCPFA